MSNTPIDIPDEFLPQGSTRQTAHAAAVILRPNAQRPAAANVLEKMIRPFEVAFDRLYGTAYNPFYRSGATAILLFFVALVTGVYTFIFYSTVTPWESIELLHNQWWGGRWIRSLHRYTADAAMFFVGFHVLKMFVQGKTWGPRLLAWFSGLVLVFFMLLCGWSGLVMVWDEQGLAVARELARLVDLLPFFSEPISRSFAGDQPLFNSFFFMSLFLHVSTPLMVAFFLWVHTSRVARPALFPPRKLGIAIIGTLLAFSVMQPLELMPKADLLKLNGELTLDAFFAFFVPVSIQYGAEGQAWFWIISVALAASVPLWWRPKSADRSAPSFVDEKRCEACLQCYLDCPYEAIQMVKRENKLPHQSASVARVTPDLCVRCGICAASCDPMSVGPPTRTGRDQLRSARDFIKESPIPEGGVAIFRCQRSSLASSAPLDIPHTKVWPVDCVGSLHMSIVEYALRRGARGALILSCPARDCSFREGPKWLVERLYQGREAALDKGIDPRRVMVLSASPAERRRIIEAVDHLRTAEVNISTKSRPSGSRDGSTIAKDPETPENAGEGTTS